MEPLHPEMRRELLRVHPEMTEVELDEYESLTAQRFTLIRHDPVPRSLNSTPPARRSCEDAALRRGPACVHRGAPTGDRSRAGRSRGPYPNRNRGREHDRPIASGSPRVRCPTRTSLAG